MKNDNLSIKEISRLAGVSTATVSRVIHNNGRFSKETENRVRKIIEELNYSPNQMAQALRTGKANVVGIIVPDITNEFFAKMTLALQMKLFVKGYSQIICNTDEKIEIEERHLQMLKSLNVSGLVYISGAIGGSVSKLSVPTIYIDRKPEKSENIGRNSVIIESDNESGGYMAGKELLGAGCKRIAAIVYKKSISSHGNRLKGYTRALKEKCIPLDENIIVETDAVSQEEGYLKTMALLSKYPDIDGVFCSADQLASGSLRALYELDIPVPERIKLTGFDDTSPSISAIIPITTVHQFVEEFGCLGADILTGMMDGVVPEQKQYTIPVELVKRAST
jgi:LacI family transcriptional regulator